MRSIGQIIDEIDRLIAAYTQNATDPDTIDIREYAIRLREIKWLRDFILNEKEHGTNARVPR